MSDKKNRKENSGLYKKDLALMYGVTVRTFSRWEKKFLNKIGPVYGRAYTPKQVRILIQCIGEPL